MSATAGDVFGCWEAGCRVVCWLHALTTSSLSRLSAFVDCANVKVSPATFSLQWNASVQLYTFINKKHIETIRHIPANTSVAIATRLPSTSSINNGSRRQFGRSAVGRPGPSPARHLASRHQPSEAGDQHESTSHGVGDVTPPIARVCCRYDVTADTVLHRRHQRTFDVEVVRMIQSNKIITWYKRLFTIHSFYIHLSYNGGYTHNCYNLVWLSREMQSAGKFNCAGL